MPTSILIDATHFRLPQPTGVEHYVDQLLPRVAQRLVMKGVQVSCVSHMPQELPGVTWLTQPYVRGWFQRRLPGIARSHDVLWTPSGTGLLKPGAAQVVTVHDLGSYALPHTYSRLERLRTQFLARPAAQVSAAVLTPSEYVKHDIVQRWHVPEDRIHVTRLAPVLAERALPPRVPLPSSYLLSVGRVTPSKGVATLMGLLEALPECSLVVAGRGDLSLFPPHLASRVTLLGYVSEEEKRWLYEHAACFLMPSASEGFGIPVAEALSLGCPVVAADAGPLPEFGDKGIRYAHPHDVSDWVTQVRAVLATRVNREQIASSHQFSWDTTALQTAGVLLAVSSQARQN